MKIAYFDCFAGVSGDMVLGALIDLGVDVESLKSMLKSLGVTPFSLNVERVNHKGITAVNLSVKTHHEHHHRSLKDILEIIDSSELSVGARQRIERIFTRIAEAESKIHQLPVEKVHFHEVGAVDSMVDIIGSVWGLEQLGVTTCYSSAVSIGSGSVECEHGIIPVPSPATLELVKGFPVIKKEVGAELATPTGAAIVTTVAEYTHQLPPVRVSKIGYGCGDRELEAFPNILRIIVGEVESIYGEDRILVAETNLDDMNAELFPYVMEKLLNHDAADVYLTPILMKKGRPGHKITVLVENKNLDRCLNILFRETTTLGVRIYETYRKKLERLSEEISSPWGAVRVKSYILGGKKHVVPEFEACKEIAVREKIPLMEIYETVKQIGNQDD